MQIRDDATNTYIVKLSMDPPLLPPNCFLSARSLMTFSSTASPCVEAIDARDSLQLHEYCVSDSFHIGVHR